MTRPRPLVATFLAVLLVGGGTAACGTDEQAQANRAKEASAAKVRAAKAAEARRAREVDARAQAAADACEATYGDLLGAEQDLDSRLGVGLKEEDYGERVGDVSAAYTAAGSQAELGCLTEVAVPLESAFNQYAKAANTWNDCVTDIDCDSDSIQGKLRSRWSKATRYIERAATGLESLRSGETAG